MKLTARARLTLLFSALIALSGAALAVIVIVITFTPVDRTPITRPPGTAVPEQTVPEKTAVDKTAVDKTAAQDFAVDVKAQARLELLDRLVTGAGVGIGALTVASAGLGWWLAGRVLRPVHVVSGTARRLSEQNLHERIPVTGPDDEMRELAETFNGMLARLQRSFDAQSHFAANAAHELRGPITTQRTLVEVAAGAADAPPPLVELAQSLGPVLRRQERLVDGLLALAWSEHGVIGLEDVHLDSLVRTVLSRRSFEPSATLSGCVVRGDPLLLDLLVDNLVRNAIRHGGQTWISTEPGVLRIENTGPVITAERLAELTEPFRRGAQDRVHGSGTGLGLAIVSAVARAHEAGLELTPRPGGGVRAEVRFVLGRTP
ncbi:MAG: ATP-binding protein [Kibdelosporangium sp.]